MSMEIVLEGNKTYETVNKVTYFGVRNELGYHLDDIFLHTLHEYYFKNNVEDCKHYLKFRDYRLLFHEYVKRLNKNRYNPERPLYLELLQNNSEGINEIEKGYSKESKDANGNIPFLNFGIKIQVPERTELLNSFKIRNYRGKDIEIDRSVVEQNKLSIVGNDLKNPRKLFNVAKLWERNKGFKIIPANQTNLICHSGREAILAIRNAKTRFNRPVTEIYFSSHGTPYAIDLSSIGGSYNLYTSISNVRAVLNKPDWEENKYSAKFIDDFLFLVNSGYLVENAIITIGACFTGGNIANFKRRIEEIDGEIRNISKENKIISFIKINIYKELRKTQVDYIKWYEANLVPFSDSKIIPGRVQNFAYLLSKKLPKATIVASLNRADSGEGINAPIVYQNGLQWFVPKLINGELMSTIHHLDSL